MCNVKRIAKRNTLCFEPWFDLMNSGSFWWGSHVQLEIGTDLGAARLVDCRVKDSI